MSLQAFALIIIAGLIHAGWNIVAKKAGGDSRFAFFTSIIMMVIWAPLGWWVGRDVVPTWGRNEWLVVLASGLLHVAYYVTLLRGYRSADLTVVYPLARGSGPLLSSLVAITLLGEQISALGALGIVGVVGGVFLIAGGPGLLRAAHDPAARARVPISVIRSDCSLIFIPSRNRSLTQTPPRKICNFLNRFLHRNRCLRSPYRRDAPRPSGPDSPGSPRYRPTDARQSRGPPPQYSAPDLCPKHRPLATGSPPDPPARSRAPWRPMPGCRAGWR